MTSPASSQPHFVGIHLGGLILRAGAIDADGTLVDRSEAPLDRENLPAQVTGIISEMRRLAPNIQSGGVAVLGLINRVTSAAVTSRELPASLPADLDAELMKATGLSFQWENDVSAAAYGESQVGAGRGARDMFYMSIGESIGGAIILAGKLWTGSSGLAGEVGHINIDREGVACECGNTGCLETVASAPNIVRRAKERLDRDSTSSLSRLAMNKAFTASDVAHEAKNGDDFALMMIERTGKYIGAGVASVINLLNIERVVLGGGVMDAGELILKPIIQEAERHAFQPCFAATQILAAQLGADASAIGAALLARDAQTG